MREISSKTNATIKVSGNTLQSRRGNKLQFLICNTVLKILYCWPDTFQDVTGTAQELL